MHNISFSFCHNNLIIILINIMVVRRVIAHNLSLPWWMQASNNLLVKFLNLIKTLFTNNFSNSVCAFVICPDIVSELVTLLADIMLFLSLSLSLTGLSVWCALKNRFKGLLHNACCSITCVSLTQECLKEICRHHTYCIPPPPSW